MKEEEEEMAPMVEKTVFTNAGNAEVRWGLVRFYFFPSDTFLSATLLCLLLLQDTVATFSFSSPMTPHSSGSSPWTLDTGQVNFVLSSLS